MTTLFPPGSKAKQFESCSDVYPNVKMSLVDANECEPALDRRVLVAVSKEIVVAYNGDSVLLYISFQPKDDETTLWDSTIPLTVKTIYNATAKIYQFGHIVVDVTDGERVARTLPAELDALLSSDI
jgi:outer membrane protein assembly factor BamB